MLDHVDRRLLARLTHDPRMSKSALGRQVGLSTPTVCSRVARLERLGVIRGYRADVEPDALGWTLSGWLRVRPAAGQSTRVAELAQHTPQITECHRVTGEDSFMIRVYATSMAEFERIHDRFLVHGETTSTIIQSSPIPSRPLPVDPHGFQPTSRKSAHA